MENNVETAAAFTLWIEAEQWPAGEWNPEDCNSDVLVTRADGSHWMATFFSYQNVGSTVARSHRSGERLSGKYFWASDMILVDEVTRARIADVVNDLIRDGGFERAFLRCDGHE